MLSPTASAAGRPLPRPLPLLTLALDLGSPTWRTSPPRPTSGTPRSRPSVGRPTAHRSALPQAEAAQSCIELEQLAEDTKMQLAQEVIATEGKNIGVMTHYGVIARLALRCGPVP
jgi:hypothetical protein